MLMTLLQANYLSLFNWVLTTSAKASIFIVFLLGVKFVLRHRMRARFQYMLWFVLIIGLVLPWTPSSPFNILNLFNSSYIQQIIAPLSNHATQPMSLPMPTVMDTNQQSLEQAAVMMTNSSQAPLGADTQLTGSKAATFAIFPFIYKLMFLIWVLGILIFTILTVIVNRRFSKKIEHNLITDPRLTTVLNKLKVELKIRTEIPLIETRYVNSPSLLGVIHPRLLLPTGIEQTFSSEQINYIFLHELLHFKRKDILINWLIQVLVIIHWFNPLIWYASYRMREDQEISCDALAMDRIDAEHCDDYAYTLIKLVQTYSSASRLTGLASLSGSKSQIKRRLTMIKDSRRGSVKWSVLGLLVIVLIASAVFTSVKNLPNYHIPVNQSDIKEIRISMNGTEKMIATKDWSSIIREFNNSKITRVRNLDVNHDLVVLFAFNDGSGRTLNFAVNGNEIRVSRFIGERKVDYIAENQEIKNIVTKLYDNADTSTMGVASTTQSTISSNSSNDLTAEQAGNSSYYPKLEITNGTQVKSNVQYSLDLTQNISVMEFLIINNSSENIELVFPNTHTFDFILTKDGNVVFDDYKDNPNVAKNNWETHQLLKANGDINDVGQGYDVWYESLTKKVSNGIYNFEFYSTSEMLKDVPHLKGQLEIKNGNVNVNSIRLN